jgi:hypothetical protein
LLLVLASGLFVLGCHNMAPPLWPWWTAQDREAATRELDAWRDSITTRGFVEGQVEELNDYTAIIKRDSSSPTGDSLIKVRHLLGFGLMTADMTVWDSLLFGVTDDSLTTDTFPTDTFCHVMAVDSSVNGIAIARFDEYWVIYYRPDTTIDTTAAPPETTIAYKLDSRAPPPRLVQEGVVEKQKPAHPRTSRYVYLRKEGAEYRLQRMSGFSLYLPKPEDAPAIRNIMLTYQGRADTFKLSAQEKLLGIYNLRQKDSLFNVRKGEPLLVFIKNDAPKLDGDLYYFLARIDGQRTALGKGTAMTAPDTVVFTQPGIHHLILEVIPQSSLFYPRLALSVAAWSLPIRVTE